MTDNALARIPVITQSIIEASTIDGHVAAMDELATLRYYADKIDATLEIKNDIGGAHVRLYRNAGQRFPSLFKRGGNGSNQYGSKEQIVSKVTLANYGFKQYRAEKCRKIAALPDDLFEDLILGIRTTEHITEQEITVPYFYRAGCIHTMRMRGINTDRPYTPATTIAISTTDMTAAARSILRVLSAGQIAQLIVELRKETTS